MATNIPKVGSLVEFTSLSSQMQLIPARTNILGDLGIFTPEYLNTDTVVIPRVTVKDYRYTDVAWGTRVKNNQNNTKGILTLPVPAFAGEDAITPLDVRGKFNWDDVVATNRPETVQALMARKMATIKQGYANTWSTAMMQLIKDGTAYAPNGTLATSYGSTVDFYQEFGVTQSVIALGLADETINPLTKIQSIIDDIQDNFRGGYVPNNFVGVADRGLFDLLARHPFVVDSVKHFSQPLSSALLNGRLPAGQGLDARYSTLDFGGITWIRAASGEMTSNEARVFPTDIPDMFKIFYAPSVENFDTVNATAEEVYYFEYLDTERKQSVEIRHESNFLCATLWPKAIVRVTL